MHRYVALIATDTNRNRWQALKTQCAASLRDWTEAFATDAVIVWIHADGASGLNFRPIGPSGVLLGRDFASDPADGAGSPALWGAYITIEADERSVRVRRDPTGRLDCWRLRLPHAELLFSHYGDVRALQGRELQINWDYLAYHLGTDWLRGRETAYVDILEVLPGEELTYASGLVNAHWFWRPGEQTQRRFQSEAAAAAGLRAAAERATRAWSAENESILLDLSGGLDSAIVLGLLRSSAKHPKVTCVNWVTQSADGDERRFAREAAEMHGVKLIEHNLSADQMTLRPSFSCRLMRPSPRSLSLGYDVEGARISKEVGATAFFTGTGGDHLFFDHLPGLAVRDLLHHRGPAPSVFSTAAAMARISGETVWSVAGALARHEIARRPPPLEARPNRLLTAMGLAQYDAKRFTHPWALEATWTHEPAKRQQVLNVAELQRHYYRYGRADAAEEIHPLFSQPVIEAALRTPAYWFAAGGRQRGLARRAFTDLLPAAIRERRTKGSNTAYWTQALIAGLPGIRSALMDGCLVAKGLLDRAVLERELTPLSLAAGKNLMALVNCLSVELWIRQAQADQEEAASHA